MQCSEYWLFKLVHKDTHVSCILVTAEPTDESRGQTQQSRVFPSEHVNKIIFSQIQRSLTISDCISNAGRWQLLSVCTLFCLSLSVMTRDNATQHYFYHATWMMHPYMSKSKSHSLQLSSGCAYVWPILTLHPPHRIDPFLLPCNTFQALVELQVVHTFI